MMIDAYKIEQNRKKINSFYNIKIIRFAQIYFK